MELREAGYYKRYVVIEHANDTHGCLQVRTLEDFVLDDTDKSLCPPGVQVEDSTLSGFRRQYIIGRVSHMVSHLRRQYQSRCRRMYRPHI
jgi:hypothetical protein